MVPEPRGHRGFRAIREGGRRKFHNTCNHFSTELIKPQTMSLLLMAQNICNFPFAQCLCLVAVDAPWTHHLCVQTDLTFMTHICIPYAGSDQNVYARHYSYSCRNLMRSCISLAVHALKLCKISNWALQYLHPISGNFLIAHGTLPLGSNKTPKGLYSTREAAAWAFRPLACLHASLAMIRSCYWATMTFMQACNCLSKTHSHPVQR